MSSSAPPAQTACCRDMATVAHPDSKRMSCNGGLSVAPSVIFGRIHPWHTELHLYAMRWVTSPPRVGRVVLSASRQKAVAWPKQHRMRKLCTSLSAHRGRVPGARWGQSGYLPPPMSTEAPTPGSARSVGSKFCALGCWDGQETLRGLVCSKNWWSGTGRVCRGRFCTCLVFRSVLGKVRGLVGLTASLPG